MADFEFDTVYSAFTGEHIAGVHVPDVEHHDTHDILIDGGLVKSKSGLEVNSGWDAVVGKSGQDRYHGAVMHASESASNRLIMEWVREMDGEIFAIVEVSAHDEHDPVFDDEPDYCETHGCAHEPAGWAIIYRTDT